MLKEPLSSQAAPLVDSSLAPCEEKLYDGESKARVTESERLSVSIAEPENQSVLDECCI